MLVKASIPITSGFEDTTTYTNAGKVRNQGLEMSLHTINLTGEAGLGNKRDRHIIRIRLRT